MKKSIKITLGLGIIGLLYFLLKKDKLTPEKFIKEIFNQYKQFSILEKN